MDGSVLLELAAADDLCSFRRAVERGADIDFASPWYGRWGNRMAFEKRTPLMIAAMYGSSSVLDFILSTGVVDVNRACGTDGFTALHCAACGGSPSCVEAANLLIAASANVDAVNAAGKKAGDLISRKFYPNGSSPRVRSLEMLLKKDFASPKKDFPPDLTLPDIKSGIYGTDEFRMYTFKVKPCSRAYSHDWTECPFVHPGENARRRDPRKYNYSCVPCPEFRKGACRNGDSCEYAHGVFESWLHPGQYRTRLCKDETNCSRRVCFFAHKPEELRSPSPSSSLPSLDIAATSLMLNQSSVSPWMMQSSGIPTPTRLLPSSRLKTISNAWESDLEMEFSSLEMAAISSPSWKNNLLSSQQLYSPTLRSSTSSMNSRASAFAKRSQSFCDRGFGTAAAPPPPLSGWASPDGKLDWGVNGDELNKLRKSMSFGIRNNRVNAKSTLATIADEPDISWVQSVVKDAPPISRESFSPWVDQFFFDQEQMVA